MAPRIRLSSLAQLAERQAIHKPSTSASLSLSSSSLYVCTRCRHASTATVTHIPAPTETQILHSDPSTRRYSALQPPSHRDPTLRKSQLLRSYVSLLQTTPLIILFQHNNLKAIEWASIRRELAVALQKVDDAAAAAGSGAPPQADNIKLSVIRTNIFEPALRIAEYYKPGSDSATTAVDAPQAIPDIRLDPSLTHSLSRAAYTSSKSSLNPSHALSPLLTGPIATLTFPTVSPAHVKAALTILSPKAPAFPAPTRRANPSWHAIPVQDGLKKLMVLGARIDGEVFDGEGVRWVGGIDGGIDGLRAQLVGMLQGVGASVTSVLEGASRSLWVTVEGRRRMLEDEAAPKGEEANKEA